MAGRLKATFAPFRTTGGIDHAGDRKGSPPGPSDNNQQFLAQRVVMTANETRLARRGRRALLDSFRRRSYDFWNAPNLVTAMVAPKLKIGRVTEPSASKPLREVMDRVIARRSNSSGLEIGTGAYARPRAIATCRSRSKGPLLPGPAREAIELAQTDAAMNVVMVPHGASSCHGPESLARRIGSMSGGA